MKSSVYLETTIISYLTARPKRDVVQIAKLESTREWWLKRLKSFKPFVSPFVLEEISKGDREAVRLRLKAVEGIPMLPLNEQVMKLGESIFQHLEIPEKARTDALHIAISAVFGMDFLLTWNCSHIANGPNILRLEKFFQKSIFKLPIICTPFELMED